MVDAAAFKSALSKFASGVTIVTTEHEGERHGLAVASFASVSLHPPLVLVSIDRQSTSRIAILNARKFAVNVLTSTQQRLGERFGGLVAIEGDRFDEGEWTIRVTGAPVLEGALASLDCELERSLDAGDHTLMVGRVVATEVREGDPIVYFNRDWRQLR